MDYQTLKYQVEEGILTLSLHRPEQLNAFTVTMSKELIAAYDRASQDDQIRVIVLTGSGKAFCAGMDLSHEGNVFGLDESLHPTLDDVTARRFDPEISEGVMDTGGQVTLAMYRCTKPIIAAINGAAVGIGATMTCAADIRFISEQARVGFVFSKLGIVPEACSSWFLPKIVGVSRALEWTYRADILAAQELQDGGFVKAVLSPEELLPEAYRLAKTIASRAPVSIALIRQMMYHNSAQASPVEAHKVESLGMFYSSLQDGNEGVQAFLEKRPSQFQSRVSDGMPDFYPWWDSADS